MDAGGKSVAIAVKCHSCHEQYSRIKRNCPVAKGKEESGSFTVSSALCQARSQNSDELAL